MSTASDTRVAPVFVCVGPNCWGKATTPNEAIKNCAKAGGMPLPELKKHYLVYCCDPSVRVDDYDGSLIVSRDAVIKTVMIEKKGQ